MLADMLPDTVTVWTPGAPDSFGQSSYTAETRTARVQSRTELARNSAGEEITSSAQVYTLQPIPEGSWVAEGDQTAQASPRGAVGAFQVRATGTSRSVSGDEALSKAWL